MHCYLLYYYFLYYTGKVDQSNPESPCTTKNIYYVVFNTKKLYSKIILRRRPSPLIFLKMINANLRCLALPPPIY